MQFSSCTRPLASLTDYKSSSRTGLPNREERSTRPLSSSLALCLAVDGNNRRAMWCVSNILHCLHFKEMGKSLLVYRNQTAIIAVRRCRPGKVKRGFLRQWHTDAWYACYIWIAVLLHDLRLVFYCTNLNKFYMNLVWCHLLLLKHPFGQSRLLIYFYSSVCMETLCQSSVMCHIYRQMSFIGKKCFNLTVGR